MTLLDLPSFVLQVDPALSKLRRQPSVAATFFAQLLMWTPPGFQDNANSAAPG